MAKKGKLIKVELNKGDKAIIIHIGSAWSYCITVDDCDDLQIKRLEKYETNHFATILSTSVIEQIKKEDWEDEKRRAEGD